jgi:hypothetical protein
MMMPPRKELEDDVSLIMNKDCGESHHILRLKLDKAVKPSIFCAIGIYGLSACI